MTLLSFRQLDYNLKFINLLRSKFCSKSKNFPFTNLNNVKYTDVPFCNDCIYYVPSDIKSVRNLGRCKKFGKKNMMTGEIIFSWADINRMNGQPCGLQAKFKETNINNFIQIIYPDHFENE